MRFNNCIELLREPLPRHPESLKASELDSAGVFGSFLYSFFLL